LLLVLVLRAVEHRGGVLFSLEENFRIFSFFCLNFTFFATELLWSALRAVVLRVRELRAVVLRSTEHFLLCVQAIGIDPFRTFEALYRQIACFFKGGEQRTEM